MTNAWYEDVHSHDEDVMVGLATQLVRVVGSGSVRSCAGYIADLSMLMFVGVLDAEIHMDLTIIEEISHGHKPCWFVQWRCNDIVR